MELSDLNSNLSNVFESSSTKDFFVDSSVDFLFDSWMYLNILFMSLKTLNFSLSGLILINLQPSFFSNIFCLSISQPNLYPHDYTHQSPLQVYNHENKYQFHILKLCNEFVYSLHQMHCLLNLALFFFVTFIMSCSLKPNIVLKFSLCFSFSNLFTP